jgi:hypothetical protein
MLSNVLIPIYSSTLTALEIVSLRQCLRIFKQHTITLVTNKKVDLTVYNEVSSEENIELKFEFFNETFFGSVYAYSQLLLNRSFYQRFSQFDYILIYQLDGFVFKDELAYWCSKNYDYIGAPWFLHYGKGYSGNKLWKVGNGGVSLRKVSTFLNAFDAPFPFLSSWYFVKSIRLKQLIPMGIRTLRMLFVVLFSQKTVEHILNDYTDERVNEDCFWAEAFQHTNLKLEIPDVLTGARFCLEKKPSYVYKLIGEQLPFCCHAFEKFEYETFWKEIIQREALSTPINQNH